MHLHRLPRLLLPIVFATVLPALRAQTPWTDGDLLIDTDFAGIKTLLRVDPQTGICQSLLTGYTRAGGAGAATFDSWRDGLVANFSHPASPGTSLLLVRSDGSTSAIAGFAGAALHGLCATGDGRVFFQPNGSSELRWIDGNDTVHTLLDAAGAAPFQFPIEHLLWHAASNALIATTSGWWSTNDCSATGCSIFRIPLAANGSRLASAPTCTSIATANQEIMSLDYLPGGQILLCLANGTSTSIDLLLRVDPVTLATSTFATPSPSNLDGAVYSNRIGKAIVLDDSANVLRTFAQATGGAGAALPTTLAVSSSTSGFSPAESLWEVDRNGPACRGSGVPYGQGLAGAGGFVPRLQLSGCSDLGTPFQLVVDQAIGSGIGLLGAGDAPANIPLLGGSLLVFPVVGTMTIVCSGAIGAPGAGTLALPLLITNPAILGTPYYFQAAFVDPAAPQGFSLTNGLQLVIG